ncbi:hypothetical protein ACFQ7F_44260 [Streptomyces sp. NPDC056486]|uniref:hypothetical protein n=1 Tax=Streptomyces sp. NPDC056486 TaxID=3345835 RepID=UPI0036AAE2FE
MAEVEELLDDVTVRMPSGAELRARGGRRTVRRRVAVAAGATALVAGAVTWAVMPAGGGGGGDGREVRPAATPTENPFMVGGVVRLLSPELMPQATKWQWKGQEEEVMTDLPLPKVGGDNSCPGSYAGRKAPNQVQYGTQYYSDKDATARQRVTEYDSESVAADEVSLLRDALTECGLREHAEGAEGAAPYWSGTTESSSRLRVSVERWRGWVSVVEVEADGRG